MDLEQAKNGRTTMNDPVPEQNNNNKRMTLEDAHIELERQGFTCEWLNNQRNDDQPINNNNMLAGFSSSCRWTLLAKLDLLVFVKQVPGQLTLDTFLADQKAIPSWVEEFEDVGGSCPPFGFGRGRQVLLLYYAETISQEVVYEITLVPPVRMWCAKTLVAAQDAEGRSYSLDDRKTPFWGRAFYPELRYRVKALTGGQVDARPPGLPIYIHLVNIFLMVYLVISFSISFSNSITDPDFQVMLIILVTALMMHFIIALRHSCFCKKKTTNQFPLRNKGDGAPQYETENAVGPSPEALV
jgi:hypothetical protein